MLGALASHGLCPVNALEIYVNCCQPIVQREEMYSYLGGIWSQFSLVAEDLRLRVDRCSNWGVSAILLPELHSSHFMRSMIPFQMRLSFVHHLIDVQGGRRFGNGERREVPAIDDNLSAYTVSTVPESDDVGENDVGMDDCDDKSDKDSMCVCGAEKFSKDDDDISRDDNSDDSDRNNNDSHDGNSNDDDNKYSFNLTKL